MLKQAILLLIQIEGICARLCRATAKNPMRSNVARLMFAVDTKEIRMISARNFCMKALLISLAAFAGYPAMAQTWDEVVEWYEAGDYPAALEGLMELADDGDPAAQNNLGFMHYAGQGVPQDYAEAARLYRLSADQGHPTAQYNLGFMYHEGQGVPQDYVESAKWYQLSADQGNSGAQYNLGLMYSQGRGVPRNSVEAARWFRLSAEQCNPYGQLNLGLAYKDGEGVFKDLVQAHVLFNLAASLSTSEDHPVRKDAERFRTEVAKSLSSADRRRAQNAAREWHESSCQ